MIYTLYGEDTFGMNKFINDLMKKEQIEDKITYDYEESNIKDVLELCHKINVPMVLDYHHFICNNEKEDINDYLKEIINTWDGKLPKMHFSSPKSKLKKEFRSHSDYINKECFIEFINILKKQDKDIDIMLEAKAKDDAISRLVRCLKYETNYKFVNETTFIA